MWRVGSSTITRRDGLLCCSKDVGISILSAVFVVLLSCRSKMAGYAAKKSVLCCWLHTSENVATWGGGRGSLCGFSLTSVYVLTGLLVGGGLVWGSSDTGSRPAPNCSHWISSSAAVVAVFPGGCRVGVGPSYLDTASPCRLLMSFWSSSAWRLAMASRFMPAVAIAWAGALVGVAGSCSSDTSDTSRKRGPHIL